MDGCWDSNSLFNAYCVKYRRRVYRLSAFVSVCRHDWLMGLFWQTPRHHASSSILCHSWTDWYVSLVLIEKIRPNVLGLPWPKYYWYPTLLYKTIHCRSCALFTPSNQNLIGSVTGSELGEEYSHDIASLWFTSNVAYISVSCLVLSNCDNYKALWTNIFENSSCIGLCLFFLPILACSQSNIWSSCQLLKRISDGTNLACNRTKPRQSLKKYTFLGRMSQRKNLRFVLPKLYVLLRLI